MTDDPRGIYAGRSVGPYEIIARIGVGGMGEVYRARDTRLNRSVAIKFLSGEFIDEAARRRFEQEARMASALAHPHIVSVHDAGEFEDKQYLVTEFIDGGTVREWMRSAKTGWEDLVELMVGVADGLACAHEAGILHRDIKPDNILVTRSGYAKLADFGLAKLAGNTPDAVTAPVTVERTQSGVIIGTLAYMSPEQVSGQRVDARSDIFAFGVVLYELLSGQKPFEAATGLETLQMIIHAAPKPLDARFPAALRQIVDRCLQKQPEQRYQSMRDVHQDLRRVVRENAATSESSRAERKPSTNRNVVAALLLLAVLAAAIFFVVRRTTTAPPRLEYTQLTNFTDSVTSPTLSPDGRMLAFIRGDNTFVGPGDIYVKLLPGGEPVQLTHDKKPKMGPLVFSPDGSQIAYSVGTNDTWVIPVLGGDPSHLLANAGGLSWIDGQRHVMYSALLGEGIHMGVFTSSESRTQQRIVYSPADRNGMAHRSFPSPDRKSVLLVEMDLGGWLPCRLVPFDGTGAGKRVGPDPAQCTDAAWSPDGQWMYFSANTGGGFHVWRQHYPDGRPQQVTSAATEEQGISFAADGRSFVTSVGSSQSTLWIHDADGERQLTSEGFGNLPSFSADGKTVYYLTRSRANRRFVSGELWAANVASGRSDRLLPDFLMEYYNVSPDGKRVVFLSVDDSGTSEVWLATLDGSATPRRLAAVSYASVAFFDPHGGVMFVGGDRGTAFLYHVNDDGSDMRKLISKPVAYLYGMSPAGEDLAVWVDEDVYVYPYEGGPGTLICSHCATAGEENRGVTPPLVSWSANGKFLYVHSTRTRDTYSVPLADGHALPPLPPNGLQQLADAGALPGARTIPEPRAYVGADPSIYVFPQLTTHRNIYRIPVD